MQQFTEQQCIPLFFPHLVGLSAGQPFTHGGSTGYVPVRSSPPPAHAEPR